MTTRLPAFALPLLCASLLVACGDESGDGNGGGGSVPTGGSGGAGGPVPTGGSGGLGGSPAAPPSCGNDAAEMGEACDGADLAGLSCESLPGFASGTLGCQPSCLALDVSDCVAGAEQQAAGCDSASVQAAIDAASDGDTVVIPAGACTWTEQVSITQGITVRGAGEEATVLTADGTTLFSMVGQGRGARLTGLGLAGTAPQYGALVYVNGEYSALRIDHIAVTNVSAPSSTVRVFWLGYDNIFTSTPAIRGVLDHITLSTNAPGNFIMLYGKDDAWLGPDDYGTGNALYVEDVDLTWTEHFPSQATPFDGEHGARFVLRHSTLTNAFLSWHDTGSTPQARSTRSYEIYGNLLHCLLAECDTAIALRGGTGVVYDNGIAPEGYWAPTFSEIFRVTFTDNGPGQPWTGRCDGTVYRICSNFRSRCSGGDHRACSGDYDCPDIGPCVDDCTSDTDCPSGTTCLENLDGASPNGWPCRDQTGTGRDDPVTHVQERDPSYLWNNTDPGTQGNVEYHPNGADEEYIQPDRDYYDTASSFDGTSGVGQGTTASRPATCTTGVGYWSTDDGALYRCSAADTWTVHYRPYPYPHPIAQAVP
jgi:hypothetical protein